MTYTRQQVADVARSMIGVRFRHQGRSRETGVDCVGMLAVMLTELGYPIIDVEGYRRTPAAEVIRATMLKNFDEIPVSEVGLGDIFIMRTGGVKPRHASVLISTETDYEKGIEPQIVHALGLGTKGVVTAEPLRFWIRQCTYGFRLRGLEI